MVTVDVLRALSWTIDNCENGNMAKSCALVQLQIDEPSVGPQPRWLPAFFNVKSNNAATVNAAVRLRDNSAIFVGGSDAKKNERNLVCHFDAAWIW